ncbi:hypothetical protein NQ318_005028 [Aromia moschata]|uniref:Uncharacterized protein n=1 Tax=Aromia moschata TaxID=1265417 RepID=A0AAV8Y9A0_9CUCU|nr:hypothetical protein NQ318_005028 [Aromia moschata]
MGGSQSAWTQEGLKIEAAPDLVMVSVPDFNLIPSVLELSCTVHKERLPSGNFFMNKKLRIGYLPVKWKSGVFWLSLKSGRDIYLNSDMEQTALSGTPYIC